MSGNYSSDTERQRTVEFRERECLSCETIGEHRIEIFHDDGYVRIQCGWCQYDQKEPLSVFDTEEY